MSDTLTVTDPIVRGLAESAGYRDQDSVSIQGAVALELNTGRLLYGWVDAADDSIVSFTEATVETNSYRQRSLGAKDFMLHIRPSAIVAWRYLENDQEVLYR